MSIQTLIHRYRCLRGQHQSDEFPSGISRCVLCGTSLAPEEDWAADLFTDEDWAADLFDDEEFL